ncbi:MAG: S1C family serine protease, partial [Clostridia bacterium]|nr:S1C family serine protease [Clostridia bacterium]
MKRFVTALATLTLAGAMLFSGCIEAKDGRDGRDGKDGQDVTIEQIYEKYKAEYGDISYADFLKEYLNYTNEELDNLTGLQAVMNKSLMSGVSVLTRFGYTTQRKNSLGFISPKTEYKLFNGSGVIIELDKEAGDAYVVTNCHVVYDDTSDAPHYSNDVRLFLYGQDEQGINYVYDDLCNISGDENYSIKAEVIGASIDYDLALLKVTGSDVLKRSDATKAVFSTQTDVYVGESVFAVGNASGEGLSVAEGVISKDSENISLSLSEKDSLLPSDYNSYRVIRTTAPINHGNSGGALFNSKGEIVGIVNAKDDSAEADNMGYALPANNARRIINLMKTNYEKNGKPSSFGFRKAFLNIQTIVTDTYSQLNAQTGRAEIYETIRVDDVLGAPARGKLQKNDLLISATLMRGTEIIDSMKITRRYYVSELLFSAAAGDTLMLTVERNGSEVIVSI